MSDRPAAQEIAEKVHLGIASSSEAHERRAAREALNEIQIRAEEADTLRAERDEQVGLIGKLNTFCSDLTVRAEAAEAERDKLQAEADRPKHGVEALYGVDDFDWHLVCTCGWECWERETRDSATDEWLGHVAEEAKNAARAALSEGES